MFLNYYTKINPLDDKNSLENKQTYCMGRIVTKCIDTFEKPINPKFIQSINKLYNKYLYSPVYRCKVKEIYYHTFQIPKRSGGLRTISAPNAELQEIQKDLLSLFKQSKFLPHNAVHSFVPFRNCKSSLIEHQRHHSRYFLKLDIQSYFDNIRLDTLKEILTDIYPFAALETAQYDRFLWLLKVCFIANDTAIPQGACTSPWISNLYLLGFDYWLTKTLGKDFVYTRYADDILISSRKSFRFDSVVQTVEKLLTTYNLTLNKKKIRYGSCNGSNWNLGIMYNKDHNLTVGYKTKHRFKCMIHNLVQLDKQSEEYQTKLAHIKGLYAYYHCIEPAYFNQLAETLKTKYSN